MFMFSSFLTKMKPCIGGCQGINTNLVSGLPWSDLGSHTKTDVKRKMSILVCVCVHVIFFVSAQVTDVRKRTSQHKGHDLKFQNRTSCLTSHVQIWVITYDLLTENNQHKKILQTFASFKSSSLSICAWPVSQVLIQ
jgi:hypothetical protein